MINIIAEINTTDIFYKAMGVFGDLMGGIPMFVAFIFGTITLGFFLDGKNYAATITSLILTYIFMIPLLLSVHILLVIFGFVVALIIASMLYNSMVVKRNI